MIMIQVNVGTWDRYLRIIVGLVLISLIFWGPKTWWGLIGIVPVLTGIFRYCPAYTLCKISTIGK
jgi:hypothetical protein